MIENEKATILWDSPIITDRHVSCNKPDTVIQKKKSDRCQIIDVAIPSDYSIQKKATEKKSKYVGLHIECQKIWNKKVEVIPVIIGATGIVDKNIKKYVGRIPGCHNIYSPQRSAILGTAHILRKVLSIKPDLVTGQDIQHHMNPRCRDYTQQNMVKSKNLRIREKITNNHNNNLCIYIALIHNSLHHT